MKKKYRIIRTSDRKVLQKNPDYVLMGFGIKRGIDYLFDFETALLFRMFCKYPVEIMEAT